MATETNVLGGRLRAARRAKDLTQEDVARRIDVRVGTVTRWERGVHEPRASQLAALAAALGLTIDQLLATTPDEETPAALSRPGV